MAPPAPPHETHPGALALAVGSGVLVAVQQRLNGGLKEALGDPVLTAVVSFGTGLLLCIAVVAARRSSRAALPRLTTLPRWTLLGGLGGATLVAVGAAAAPEIGVALLTVGLVGGQTVGGVLVDTSGLAPGGRRALTPARAAGAVLCLVAIVVAALGEAGRGSPLLLALVLLAGLAIAVQQALNGRVRAGTGDPAVATLVNFVVGTVALCVGLGLRAAVTGGLEVQEWPTSWWLYLGGPMGAVFVAVAAMVVGRLGVLRLGLAVTAGQLLGSIAVDVLTPLGSHLGPFTVVGAVLTLVAVRVSGRPPRVGAVRPDPAQVPA